MDLLKRARNVVHVRLRAEEEALLQPNPLLRADQIAVGTGDLGIVQFADDPWQIRAKRLIAEHRLMMERESVPGRARDALGLEGLEHRGARSTKPLGLEPQHKQMITMAQA